MPTNWSTPFRYWILSLVAVLSGLTLWFARELISPLIIGALLAFVLDPAITFLQKRTRLSHSVMVSIVVLGGLLAIVAILAILTPTLITEAQVLAIDLQQIFTDVQAFLAQPINLFGLQFDLQNVLPDFANLLSESVTAIPESAVLLIEATSRNIIWALVIIATTYYLLRDWERLRNWVYDHIPTSEQAAARRIYQQTRDIWLGYFRGNLLLMLIVGIVFTLTWSLIGLPGAVILGVIAGVLTIIPDLGPAIAAVFAVLVALVEGSLTLPLSNILFAVLVLAIYLVLINIKSIWLRPRIFARSVHMHDGIVFIAIMAAVVLQGILAAIVVVPIMATTGVLARYVYRRLRGLPYSE